MQLQTYGSERERRLGRPETGPGEWPRPAEPEMAAATAREEDEAARPLLLPRSAQEDQAWWRRWAREAGWVGYLALPMVVVNLSQYAVQVSSNMMVGHLPGVLPLSSAAIATSLANVSGFSLLVRTLLPFPPVFVLVPIFWALLFTFNFACRSVLLAS